MVKLKSTLKLVLEKMEDEDMKPREIAEKVKHHSWATGWAIKTSGGIEKLNKFQRRFVLDHAKNLKNYTAQLIAALEVVKGKE